MTDKTETVTIKQAKPRDPIYIVIIILLLIGGGLMYYEMNKLGKQLDKCSAANEKLDGELKYVIAELGSDPEEFKNDLANLLTEYDTLISINQQLGDQKNLLMDSLLAQRNKILQLQEEVKRGKWSAWELRKKEKELDVLRKVMQGYVGRIDSLISENDILRGRLNQTETKLNEATETIGKYAERTDKLEQTVATGQILKTTNLVAEGIRLKNNGDQRQSDRAKRVDRVKACFTLMENRIARAGTKTLYMRVIGPNAAILSPSSSQTFDMNGVQGVYSVSREVEYQNQDMDVCFYYIMNEEAVKGTYVVEIWADGAKIGTTTFDLK